MMMDNRLTHHKIRVTCLILGLILPTWAGVSLQDEGSTITLSNSLVTGTIAKENGQMTSLAWRRGPNLIGQSWYWNINTEGSYESLNNAEYRLVRQQDDLIEVAFKQSDMAGGELSFDVHYVLTNDLQGFYVYTILSHAAGRAWSLEQARGVVRNNPDLFYMMIADDQRQVIPPTPQELDEARENGGILSPDEATLLPDGTVHDKYLMSDFMGEHHVHGWVGDGYGLWMISPSNEHQNGGPTSQELTVHQTETTPVILRNLQGSHYGSGIMNLDEGESWSKLYGPFLLYINKLETPAEQWSDAKARTELEKSQWPYHWMAHPLYPLQRGTVQGQLVLADGTSPENAMVLLAQPEDGNTPHWQQQGRGYQFFDRADANGTFVIEHVRPGPYSLFAFVTGVPEEFNLNGIVVEANEVLDLNEVTWTPESHGRIAWQLGTFDRSAGEYKYGNLFHDGHSWGKWLNYPTDFPDDIRFVIGQSQERTDWNYVQMAYELEDGSFHKPYWDIEFELGEVPEGVAVLTIGLAAQRKGALEVQINGTTIHTDPDLQAGAACVRNSIQGTYQLKRLSFSTSLLHSGTNTVTLGQYRGRTFANIMYDALRLELPKRAR